jgi:hypothetical protein
MGMHSSYLKPKPACPVMKLNLNPARQYGFDSGFLSRMFGSPVRHHEKDMMRALVRANGTHAIRLDG